jgi:hypothetical protein
MRHIGLGLLLLVAATGARAQDAAHREEFARMLRGASFAGHAHR